MTTDGHRPLFSSREERGGDQNAEVPRSPVRMRMIDSIGVTQILRSAAAIGVQFIVAYAAVTRVLTTLRG